MLAYILWHWPFPEVQTQDYESSLVEFHQSLTESTIPGFIESITFRSRGAPWLGSGERGYEDWYLLDGSAAIDLLNEALVSTASKLAHDTTAHAAAGAAAGLYQLQKGEPAGSACRFASWLAKPPGTTYEEFYAGVLPWTSQPEVSLWRRQMVLGPTPEFGVFSPRQLELPSNLLAASVELELVWP